MGGWVFDDWFKREEKFITHKSRPSNLEETVNDQSEEKQRRIILVHFFFHF